MVSKLNVGTTYYYLLIDESGSMRPLAEDVKRLYIEKIRDLQKEAIKTGQKVIGSVGKFSYTTRVLNYNTSLESLLHPNNISNYRPNGGTALFDAVGDTIETLSQVYLRPNDAILIEVLTDGEENESKKWEAYGYTNPRSFTQTYSGKKNLNAEINQCQQTGQWTFIFQVPRGHKSKLVSQFGISSDNVNEWDCTQQGLQETHALTSQGYTNYFNSRQLGKTKTTAFYTPVDLSNMKASDVNKLTDLSRYYREYEVPKEVEIRQFVEEKTGIKYVVGQGMYELVKREKVKDDREILVVERGKNKIYGGKEARKLIGLPEHGDAVVDPINLSNWRLFCESRSFNRKLPRGSKILIEKNPRQIKKPTWGTNP